MKERAHPSRPSVQLDLNQRREALSPAFKLGPARVIHSRRRLQLFHWEGARFMIGCSGGFVLEFDGHVFEFGDSGRLRGRAGRGDVSNRVVDVEDR